eukprot:scaffold32979_cov54-Phaeocystis_antarctica.AAC.5
MGGRGGDRRRTPGEERSGHASRTRAACAAAAAGPLLARLRTVWGDGRTKYAVGPGVGPRLHVVRSWGFQYAFSFSSLSIYLTDRGSRIGRAGSGLEIDEIDIYLRLDAKPRHESVPTHEFEL